MDIQVTITVNLQGFDPTDELGMGNIAAYLAGEIDSTIENEQFAEKYTIAWDTEIKNAKREQASLT